MKLFPTFYIECKQCGLLFKSYKKMFKHCSEVHPKIREDNKETGIIVF